MENDKLDRKLKRLGSMLDALEGNNATVEQLEDAFSSLMLVLNGKFDETESSLDSLKYAISRLDSKDRELSALLSNHSQEMQAEISRIADSLIQRIEGIQLQKGDKGDDAEPSEVAEFLKNDSEFIESLKANELDLSPEEIRNHLEVLNGEERLKRSAIDGLDDYEEVARLAKEPKTTFMGGGNVEVYNTTGKVGSSQRLRFSGATVTNDTDGAVKITVTGGEGSAAWGDITGTLSDQTDLQSALDAKAASNHTHAIDDLTDVTITNPTDGQVLKYNGSAWVNGTDETAAGASGITRSINSISSDTTAGASADTDYVYLVSGTTTLTLPTAVGNDNRYTAKNTGAGAVTIATTSSQTIDGTTTIIVSPEDSVDLISDGSNWFVI